MDDLGRAAAGTRTGRRARSRHGGRTGPAPERAGPRRAHAAPRAAAAVVLGPAAVTAPALGAAAAPPHHAVGAGPAHSGPADGARGRTAAQHAGPHVTP
ncbi:hypothetical protein ACF073_15000 [Streptomyces sp. NPDC015171]|uniref:hypothetical protein n=1 Tax=Streptomyces sp. NPDC015171 TaxID=3364945 RepID=UPI0036F80FA1